MPIIFANQMVQPSFFEKFFTIDVVEHYIQANKSPGRYKSEHEPIYCEEIFE